MKLRSDSEERGITLSYTPGYRAGTVAWCPSCAENLFGETLYDDFTPVPVQPSESGVFSCSVCGVDLIGSVGVSSDAPTGYYRSMYESEDEDPHERDKAEEEAYFDELYSPDVWCGVCGSANLTLLGELGGKTWYRCRDCGMETKGWGMEESSQVREGFYADFEASWPEDEAYEILSYVKEMNDEEALYGPETGPGAWDAAAYIAKQVDYFETKAFSQHADAADLIARFRARLARGL